MNVRNATNGRLQGQDVERTVGYPYYVNTFLTESASLLVGCLTYELHANVSRGRICSDNFTCCYTEIELADQTFHLIQSQYTDTTPTSPSTDPITPGAWQGSHWSVNFEVTDMTRPPNKSRRKRDSNPGSPALEEDAITTTPTMRSPDGVNPTELLSLQQDV